MKLSLEVVVYVTARTVRSRLVRTLDHRMLIIRSSECSMLNVGMSLLLIINVSTLSCFTTFKHACSIHDVNERGQGICLEVEWRLVAADNLCN